MSAGLFSAYAALAAVLVTVGVLASVAAALLIRAGMPLLMRYAMARPNARSSHRVPTPQGAGGPLLIAALIVFLFGFYGLVQLFGWHWRIAPFHWVLVLASLAIAAVGAVDDIRPLSPKVRLVLQTALVAAVLLAAPAEWRLAPAMPYALERTLAVIAGVWFVNLTNFMDGIDGITVAEMAPVSGALALYLAYSGISFSGALLAAALCGALVGFLVFNAPPARVFLGDVGSLPIGLVVAALLFEAATNGALIPAIIVPLYYLFDATETLLKGLAARENVFAPHRRHAYQNAVDGGWSARRVDLWVLALNGALVLLAGLALRFDMSGQAVLLIVALALTVFVSRSFRGAKR